jgi:hypothetical protein
MRFFVHNNWTAFNQDGQKQRQGMSVMSRVNWDATTVEQLKTLESLPTIRNRMMPSTRPRRNRLGNGAQLSQV